MASLRRTPPHQLPSSVARPPCPTPNDRGFLPSIRPELIHAVLFDESVELPSDYRGVEYIKIDAEGAWKFKLAKEMKAAGLQVDRNKAI